MFGCVKNRVPFLSRSLPVASVFLLLGCPFDSPRSYSVETTSLIHVDPKADSLNDADVVGGNNARAPVILGPVVWANGQPSAVENNFEFGAAHGINNKGTVVGFEQTTGPDVQFHLVATINGDEPLSDAETEGEFYSVSELDEFVGFSFSQAALGSVSSGDLDLFRADGSLDTKAYDINDLGDFVGSGSHFESTRAVKWQEKTEVPLNSLGGPFSEAYAINNHRVPVGVSTKPAPPGKTTVPHLAVYWNGASVIPLPTLGGEESTAWDINNDSEAVGFSQNESNESRAVVWRNVAFGTPTVTDLNEVADFSEVEGALVLLDAIDINEAGTILCEAELTIDETTETVFVLLRL
jgi:hypothetical protein